MTVDFADTWREKVLDYVLGISPAADRYIAILGEVAVPGDTGSTITESDYPAYERVEFLAADWSATSSGRRRNEADVLFPTVDEGGHVAVGFALLTAATAGELVAYHNLDDVDWRTFTVGQTPRIAINQLAMALSALVDE